MDETTRATHEAGIRRVIDRYCHAVDRGSADDVAALFHSEGTLLATFEDDGVYKGRAAIRQWYAEYHRDFRAKLSHLRHKISNILIDFEGEDEARVVSYLDADIIIEGDTVPRAGIGRYDDRFVRENGEWCFGERAIVIYHADPALSALLAGE